MRRALASAVVTLAVCTRLPFAAAQEPSGGGGPVITKPPKLVKFVPAVYPKDKHDAGVTADVLLSIEIGADGQVGEVEVVKGAGPDFDAAAAAAAKQFVFEPAEIDNQPAPVKITYKYAFTIIEKMVKAGPQINFDGVVLERLKKTPMRRVTVKVLGVEGVKGEDDGGGRFCMTDVTMEYYK